EIAATTQYGLYLPLRGPKVMDSLYAQRLALLPKTEHQEKFVHQYIDRFRWPLGLAMVLLVTEMLFPERKREPKARAAKAGTGVPALAPTAAASLLVLALLTFPNAALGSTASALREYKSGNYDESLKEYEKLLQKKNNDPRLHFNAGTAAYRNQQFEEAAKQF